MTAGPRAAGRVKVGKRTVDYRRAAAGARRRCGTCVMFRPVLLGFGSCTLVRGLIAAEDVCDRWKGKR